MAKWGEIKCERCAENDALWEGMERALEESDAREARLEARIEELEAKLRKIGESAKSNAYGSAHIICHTCSDTHHAVEVALKGQDDE